MSAQILAPQAVKPRLGFLGLGWIGQHRLQAILDSGCADVVALADSIPEAAMAAKDRAPSARIMNDLHELVSNDLDGIVIATPNALHADEARYYLEQGLAVFCQKPLGRNTGETRLVVETARSVDRLLAVDLSYRFVEGVDDLREWIQSGQLGEVFAVQSVFHNAYGPNKSWFYDKTLAGGGCLLDLGIHLVDFVLSTLGWPQARPLSARLLRNGKRLTSDSNEVEDYASAQIELGCGASFDLACSWNLPIGREAHIEISFFGTREGASIKNVNGSFFDFTIERNRGTRRETVLESDRSWFGAAAVDWARRLQNGERFDRETERLVEVAALIDAIYEEGEPA